MSEPKPFDWDKFDGCTHCMARMRVKEFNESAVAWLQDKVVVHRGSDGGEYYTVRWWYVLKAFDMKRAGKLNNDEAFGLSKDKK